MTGPLTAYYTEVGLEFARWRKACKLSQTQVAKRLGLLQSQVSQIELGLIRQPADRLHAYIQLLSDTPPSSAQHRLNIWSLLTKPPSVGQQMELPQ